MKNSIIKGLFLAIATIAMAFTQANGFPADAQHWEALGLAVFGTSIIYIAQSFAIPTTSILGKLNIRDFVKGLIVVLGNGLVTFGADKLTGTKVDIGLICSAMGAIIFTYIVKQFNLPAKAA